MKTHIFDMDGLLIDSEPFWRAAEIKVFNRHNLNFTENMCRETVGMRIDEVVSYWNKKLNIYMPVKETSEEIVSELISLVKSKGKPLPGVLETLETLKKHNRKIALASSSSMKIIKTVVEKLNIQFYFDVLHSAEFEKHGKPAPDVFLTTADLLNDTPENCIVYEDSKNGMRAGLGAKMKTILVPEFPDPHMKWHDEADLKWSSLNMFSLIEAEV